VASDGSTQPLKINYLPRERSGEKERRGGNGGGRGFLRSAGLWDVSRSDIVGMLGREPCHGRGSGQLPPRQPRWTSAWLLRSRLRPGGKQEETNARKQICRISCIRKAFGPSPPGLSRDGQLSGATIAGSRRQLGAGWSRRARKSTRRTKQPAFRALLFIEERW